MLTEQPSGLGGWSGFNFILLQLWVLLSRDWQQPTFILLVWTTLLNRLWKEPRSLNRRARVRHRQKRGGGRRRMNKLKDPPELLPHHGIITTKPLDTLSGQEVFCFQILRKSLWSKETKARCLDYYKQLNMLWRLLLANLFPTEQHGGSGGVHLWRNDRFTNKG